MTEIPSDTDSPEQLLKILLAREHARADAYFRKDPRALDALLAPDYIEINNFGRFTRDDILKRIFPLFSLQSFAIETPQVRRTGKDTAEITYQCTEDITLGKVNKVGNLPGNGSLLADRKNLEDLPLAGNCPRAKLLT